MRSTWVWRPALDGLALTRRRGRRGAGGELPAVHGADGAGIWNGGEGVKGQLHAAWGAFVSAGSLASPELPDWPRYSLPDRATMIFQSGATRVEKGPDAARRAPRDGCDWESGTWYQLDGVC